MKSIPDFPDGREICLEDKPKFDSLLHSRQPEISAYTFTNLFAWRVPYNTRLSQHNGLIIVSYNVDGKRQLLEPLGEGDKAVAIKDCLQLSQDIPTSFKCIPYELVQLLAEESGLEAVHDRDNSDYLYRTEDLINLPGRKYDGKRNYVTRFKQSYEYTYKALTADNVEECHDFAERWCEDRVCETSEGLQRERCAVHEMLMNFGTLGLFGGEIWVDGQLVAFSIGERLNANTMVVHAEKGDSAYSGVYQMMNNEFCIQEAQDFEFVNREQDLGIPGLRKAKKSYNPVKLVEAYKVKLKHKTSLPQTSSLPTSNI